MPSIFHILPAVAASIFLSACATHLDDSRNMRAAWKTGDYNGAKLAASEMSVEYADTADALVWKLDLGSTARAAGDLSASDTAFESAYSMMQNFDRDAEIDLGAEAKALVTNLSYLPYTGYNYDRIMTGVYLSLNCMQTGDINGAAVMLKRVQNFQQDTERKNESRIRKELDSTSKLSGKKVDGQQYYDSNRAMNDSKFRGSVAKIYGQDATRFKGVRGDYVNPFAYWLDGVYFMACNRDAADRSRAADSFRILSSMVNNSYVASDLAESQKVAAGAKMAPATYVIFATGMAPIRNQVRIDIPMFLATREVPYVGVNFPKLEYNSNYSPEIDIRAGNQSYRTQTIADFDKIVAREFYDELPLVIAKTLLSAGTKAALQYGMQEGARAAGGGDAGLLAVMIIGSVYQAMMNDADLRTWTTLPKQIKIAKIPTPADRLVRVGGVVVKLDEAPVNIICVTKPSAGAALSIKSFPLGLGVKKKTQIPQKTL